MIDDAFVFDCVAHVFNFNPKNAFDYSPLIVIIWAVVGVVR